MFDSQRLSFVHAQRPGTRTVPIAFWPVFLAIAGLAVDLVFMGSHSSAI